MQAMFSAIQTITRQKMPFNLKTISRQATDNNIDLKPSQLSESIYTTASTNYRFGQTASQKIHMSDETACAVSFAFVHLHHFLTANLCQLGNCSQTTKRRISIFSLSRNFYLTKRKGEKSQHQTTLTYVYRCCLSFLFSVGWLI
jgi:hypothetical protein